MSWLERVTEVFDKLLAITPKDSGLNKSFEYWKWVINSSTPKEPDSFFDYFPVICAVATDIAHVFGGVPEFGWEKDVWDAWHEAWKEARQEQT